MSDQRWDPERYEKSARFVSDLGMPVVELLAPRPGEAILDLGCGDGALTAKLVAVGCRVVAVDASPAQVEGARARGLDARVLDARQLDFASEFDAVFSNAVLHWVPDADAVIDGVWRALRPGGRFVGEFGGEGNVAAIEGALEAALHRRGVDPKRVNPWYYPSPAAYGARLAARGFTVRSAELITRPTPLPGDVVDWIETFAQPFIAAAPDRAEFLAEVKDALRPVLCDAAGKWTADYVRLRFAATRP